MIFNKLYMSLEVDINVLTFFVIKRKIKSKGMVRIPCKKKYNENDEGSIT